MKSIITIDGPSGSGKGTVCRLVADALGWHLLDSGALYRLTACAAGRADVALDDERALEQLAARLDVAFQHDGRSEQVLLDGEDVTAELRAETTGERASQIAALTGVRRALIERQRAFARPPGLVADGRDMGTVIFPGAPLKVFLTASPSERAQRRYKQLKDNNIDVSLAALLRDIEQRDLRDASRSVAPLVPADDAVIVDSTGVGVDQVVSIVLGHKNRVFGVGGSC